MNLIDQEAAKSIRQMRRDIDEAMSRGSELPVYRAALTLPLTQAGITAVVGSIAEYPSGWSALLLNTGGSGEVFYIAAIDGSWRTWAGATP